MLHAVRESFAGISRSFGKFQRIFGGSNVTQKFSGVSEGLRCMESEVSGIRTSAQAARSPTVGRFVPRQTYSHNHHLPERKKGKGGFRRKEIE